MAEGQDDHHGHDVHFESADAGASLTYPQQAGTIRKNGFLVIKGRPCKVRRYRASCSDILESFWQSSVHWFKTLTGLVCLEGAAE
jgi:hypothetical protein